MYVRSKLLLIPERLLRDKEDLLFILTLPTQRVGMHKRFICEI